MNDTIQKWLIVAGAVFASTAMLAMAILLLIPAGAIVLAFIIVGLTNDKAKTKFNIRYDRRDLSSRGVWKIY